MPDDKPQQSALANLATGDKRPKDQKLILNLPGTAQSNGDNTFDDIITGDNVTGSNNNIADIEAFLAKQANTKEEGSDVTTTTNTETTQTPDQEKDHKPTEDPPKETVNVPQSAPTPNPFDEAKEIQDIIEPPTEESPKTE